MNKEELLNQLSSQDKKEVREAILSLEKFENEEVIKKIVETILKIKSKIILEAAQEVLINFKNKKSLSEHCIDLIFSDSPKIRHVGINILVSCGNEAIDIIKKKLVFHDDFNMRKYALDILKEIKTEESLEVIKCLIKDNEPNVKYSAIEFLMEFTKFKEKVVEILLDFLEQEEFKTLYAVTAVASTIIYGHFFNKKFIPIIREKLKTVEDKNIKHWLHKILIYLGDEEIIPEAKENAKEIGMLNVIAEDIVMAKINIKEDM